jgi:hypothetical protein
VTEAVEGARLDQGLNRSFVADLDGDFLQKIVKRGELALFFASLDYSGHYGIPNTLNRG